MDQQAFESNDNNGLLAEHRDAGQKGSYSATWTFDAPYKYVAALLAFRPRAA
jgi:hypothetical protein